MINLAVVGKGGSGKTFVTGTMARLLAKRGNSVLAVDGDPNPNLALTLGIPAERIETLPTLPPLDDLCSAHSVEGKDGVKLLVMATLEGAGGGCNGRIRAGVSHVTRLASGIEGGVCVVDTDATIEQFVRLSANALHVDVMLVAVEPYFASLEAGRRMARLAQLRGYERVALVANKVRDEDEQEAVYEFASDHGLGVAGVVPYDARLPEADWAQRAPLDFDPKAAAVAAIDELCARLISPAGF